MHYPHAPISEAVIEIRGNVQADIAPARLKVDPGGSYNAPEYVVEEEATVVIHGQEGEFTRATKPLG
jgi:hypothetical protein